MLLNTVIISLNQFLPLALLWVLLLHSDIERPVSLLSTWQTLVLCATSCAVFLAAAGTISQWFDYRGLEICKILMLVSIFGCVMGSILSSNERYKQAAIVLASMLYLSHFIMYLNSYWHLDTLQGLLIGSILGLGICLSFSTLFYFSLAWLRAQRALAVVLILLTCHTASKISNAVDLAAQIDLLPSSETVFDLRFLLDEYGIIGRIFKALLGYEATPSYANLWAFCCAVLLLGVTIVWRLKRTSTTREGVMA